MRFKIEQDIKRLVFDSDIKGLMVGGKEFVSGKDGALIYDQVAGLNADLVELQMSTNTSTLVPALKILSLKYSPYFDDRTVIESQNNITFYWDPSKLAAFYNLYSTDNLGYLDRKPVIRRAVKFLLANTGSLPLEDEYPSRMKQQCILLGFYQGFPIFDGSSGFAKLQSRLGIHLDPEEVMISTPLDIYERDVYDLADVISKTTGLNYSRKKNRVIFPRDRKLIELIGIGGPA